MSTQVTKVSVPSQSNPNKSYMVRAFRNDETNEVQFKCGCPHFVFREKECKHISNVKMLIKKGTIKLN